MSRLIHGIRNSMQSDMPRYAVFHQCTGECAFIKDHAAARVLHRIEQCPTAEWPMTDIHPPIGPPAISVPSDLIRLFGDYLLDVPADCPAVTYTDERGRAWVARTDAANYRSGSGRRPAVIVEPLPRACHELLRAAETSSRLRDLIDDDARPETSTREVAQGILWLTDPVRQMLRLRPVRQRPLYVDRIWRNISCGNGPDDRAASVDDYRDLREPTVSHCLRFPTDVLHGQSYGERLCESVLADWPRSHASGATWRVLECGGGTGALATSFARRLQAAAGLAGALVEYHLLDIDPGALAAQSRRVTENRIAVQCHRADATTFDIPGNTFDIILANETVADLPFNGGTLQFVERARQHLSRAGVLLVIEHGSTSGQRVKATCRDHEEWSCDFLGLQEFATTIGLTCGIIPLCDYLRVNRHARILNGCEEKLACLRHALELSPGELPYAACDEQRFVARYGSLISARMISGLSFSALNARPQYLPRLDHFFVARMEYQR